MSIGKCEPSENKLSGLESTLLANYSSRIRSRLSADFQRILHASHGVVFIAESRDIVRRATRRVRVVQPRDRRSRGRPRAPASYCHIFIFWRVATGLHVVRSSDCAPKRMESSDTRRLPRTGLVARNNFRLARDSLRIAGHKLI